MLGISVACGCSSRQRCTGLFGFRAEGFAGNGESDATEWKLQQNAEDGIMHGIYMPHGSDLLWFGSTQRLGVMLCACINT